MKKDRLELIKHGSTAKALFRLSAPTVIAMLVLAIYNFADTAFVAKLHDVDALSATQLIFPVFQLIGALGLTFGMGAASVISRKLGENKNEEAQRAASFAFYCSIVTGLILSIIGIVIPQLIINQLGTTDSNYQYSIDYGRIILGGSIFQVLNMFLNNILRSEGAAKESGIGQLTGALLNIALDPLFIFTFGMGIKGAAAATILAQSITTCILLSFIIRKKSIITLSIRYIKISIQGFLDIMQMGFPVLIRQIVSAVSFIILNILAREYGAGAQAAIGVTLKTFMIVLMVLFGLSQGLQPLVGYNYGAGNLSRTKKSLHTALLWTFIFTTVSALFFILSARIIMPLFFKTDPESAELAIFALRSISLGLFPIGMVVIYGGYFQAVGDGLSSFILAIFQQGLLLIPMLFLFNTLWGVKGLLLAQPVAYFIAWLLAELLRIRLNWKENKKTLKKSVIA